MYSCQSKTTGESQHTVGSIIILTSKQLVETIAAYIYILYIYIYIYIYIYRGSISSLMHISLNNIDMFWQPVLVYVLSSCPIDFMASGGNWLMNSTTNCYPSTFCSISSSQLNEHCNTPTNKQKFIKLFYPNQMHYNYKLDENMLKTLIKRKILPSDPN